jgi:hypothetical protein
MSADGREMIGKGKLKNEPTRKEKNMYNIKLSKTQIENILKALAGAGENEILEYEAVGKLYDYIVDEMQKQQGEENQKSERADV